MAGRMTKCLKSRSWDVNSWCLLTSAVFHGCNIMDSLRVHWGQQIALITQIVAVAGCITNICVYQNWRKITRKGWIILTVFGGVISMHISSTTWLIIVAVMHIKTMMIIDYFHNTTVSWYTYIIQYLMQGTEVVPSEHTIMKTSEPQKLKCTQNRHTVYSWSWQ